MDQAQVEVEQHLENASSVGGRDTGQTVRPLHHLHLHTNIHWFHDANDGTIACPNATEEGRGSSTVKRARTESFQSDPSSRSGGRGGVQGECYKCRQPGHWANACPSEEGVGYEQQSSVRNTKTRTRGRGSTKRGRGRRGRGSLSKKGSFDAAAADDWY